MNKVFLYLYPIEEYNKTFLFPNEFYDSKGRKNPLDVLNDCIDKRYRNKGYKVVFALYPDKSLYGVNLKESDSIIYTDVSFKEASGYNEDGTEKMKSEIKYPNEEFLLSQIKDVEKIVIGGFHWNDCVRKVAEVCQEHGIDTLVDLDLTDMFFNLYYLEDYFIIDEYDPKKYKNYRLERIRLGDRNHALDFFNELYNSNVFGFDDESNKKVK